MISSLVKMTTKESSQFIRKLREIMAKGGFNLWKWRTLLKEIAKFEVATAEIPARGNANTVEDDESYAKSSTGLKDGTSGDDHMVKVLGIKWNTLNDEFIFTFAESYNYVKSLLFKWNWLQAKPESLLSRNNWFLV